MSASDGNKIISISNVDDEDEDEEVDESENDVVSNHRTRTTPFVAAQRQFAKFQSKFRRIRSSKRSLLASSSSSSSSSSLSSQKNAKSTVNDDDDGNRRRRRSGCKFCCLRPQVLESLDGSPTISDPNNPNFTHSMLRVLIETNDFYSKDCNPHLDPS